MNFLLPILGKISFISYHCCLVRFSTASSYRGLYACRVIHEGSEFWIQPNRYEVPGNIPPASNADLAGAMNLEYSRASEEINKWKESYVNCSSKNVNYSCQVSKDSFKIYKPKPNIFGHSNRKSSLTRRIDMTGFKLSLRYLNSQVADWILLSMRTKMYVNYYSLFPLETLM